MEVLYLPRVAEEHYKELEAVLRCHRSFPRWLKLVAEWRGNAQSQGKTVRDIAVDPEEFCRYLADRSVPHDLNQLLVFTAWVGQGRPA